MSAAARAVSAVVLAAALVGSQPAYAAPGGGVRAATQGCSDGAGTRISQDPPALGSLQAQLAWKANQGNGVVVAVVDSGVDASNPHLKGVLAGGIDLVGDGKGQSAYTDQFGHGTAVAGEIAARRIDGSGVVGLAPQARILSVRVFASTDDDAIKAGMGPSIARLAAGIRQAADSRAQIINVSLSTSIDDHTLKDAVAYASAHGSLVVASAGNSDASLSVDKNATNGSRYPAGDPGAVGVAAADSKGVVTDASIHGPHVALSAPGQNVLTAAQNGIDCIYATDAPATSFATAYVSAAAALVASQYPQETPAQWAYRLTATAVRADPDRREDEGGWGLVQPYEAMVIVPGAGVRGPTSPFPGSPAASGQHVSGPDAQIAHQDTGRDTALTIAVFAGVIGAVVLAAIGAAGFLVRRRRA